MTSAMERLDKYRGQVDTRSGPASCVDTGGPGRVGLFVHGLGTSSYPLRHVIDQLDGHRRCVAVGLPLHGRIPAAGGQDFSLPGFARFLADFCDALQLNDIDLVANDTGRCYQPSVRRGPRQCLVMVAVGICLRLEVPLTASRSDISAARSACSRRLTAGTGSTAGVGHLGQTALVGCGSGR